MNNAQKISEAIGHVSEGWAQVPVIPRPPKIHWGEEFLAWPDAKKIDYLTKFAEAMNHAADIVQKERDSLGRLAEKKEMQLEQMQARVEAADRMLQGEVTRMNEDRQRNLNHVQELNARIRELEAASEG